MPLGGDGEPGHRKSPPVAFFCGLGVATLCSLMAVLRPLFHDEASTLFFSDGELGHLGEMVRQDIHPPGYFLLAWVWLRLAALMGLGHGDLPLLVLRLFSSVSMGMGAGVFVKAIPLFTGRKLSGWAAAAVAVSPFLIFCGYFARYYSLTCLLWAMGFYALGRLRAGLKGAGNGDGRVNAAVYGAGFSLCVGALWLVNYAACVVALAGFSVLLVPVGRRAAGWKLRLALVLPAFINFLIVLPLLWTQLSLDLPRRLDSDNPRSLMMLAKNAAFLVWTLAVGDGMPPWSIAGLITGLLVLSATAVLVLGLCGRAWQGRREESAPARRFCPLILMAVAMMGAGAAVGWVFLPGAGYSFLPPRVALCGFAWLMVSAVAGDAAGAVGRWYLWLLTGANLLATGCLLTGGFTNWAYVVPAPEIAAHTAELARRADGPTTIYLPEKSMRNILYYLQRAPLPANATVATPEVPSVAEMVPGSVIVIRQSTSAPWPPSQAVHDGALPDPVRKWQLQTSAGFLQEPADAARIKRLLAGREVHSEKITVDLWVPAEASAP